MLSKLTIAIPTYNRNDYLLKLFHTIPNDFHGKVVVSDNGNYVTDVIKSDYLDYDFHGIQEKVEMFQNWNRAIDYVNTEWFMIPSDDDVFYPDSFNIINKILNEHPEGDIFIFGHNVIDENDNVLHSWKPERYHVYKSPYGFNIFSAGVDARCPSIIMRTEFAKKLGKFDESFKYTAADSLLIQKCLLYGNSVFVPEVISGYRTWPNNFTSQLNATKEWMTIIRRWTDKIADILSTEFSKEIPIKNINNFKDEIFGRNLLSGLINKRSKEGMLAAFKFVRENGFPFHADLKTKLRIVKSIMLK